MAYFGHIKNKTRIKSRIHYLHLSGAIIKFVSATCFMFEEEHLHIDKWRYCCFAGHGYVGACCGSLTTTLIHRSTVHGF